MKSPLLAVIAALVMMSSSSALAAQSINLPDPKFNQALAPINTVVAALGTGDTKSVKGLYSNDAVVIDNVGNLRWNGATAGEDWLSNVAGPYGKFTNAKFTALPHPEDISFSDRTAYIVVYGTITSKTPGHPFQNYGAFTFTLNKASGTWKITTQTFSPLFGLGPSHSSV
jgi:hypothetical protein